MENEKIFATLKQQLNVFKKDTDKYFGQIFELPDDDVYFANTTTDYYWEKLPLDLQNGAEKLIETFIPLAAEAISYIKRSSLLSDADQRDFGFLVKAIRAAIHLHDFSHWDAEVLHDEGTILGIQPSGQREDSASSPKKAYEEFNESFKNIIKILDLVVDSSYEPQLNDLMRSSDLIQLKPNTAFIMMWMDRNNPHLVDVYDCIKQVFNSFGINAVRADEIEHSDIITETIIKAIQTSEFLIADLTGERPSVYYEIGYAHALKKRVILIRDKGTKIHFDLAAYNCPEYENIRELTRLLTKRLEQLTNKKLPNPEK